MLLALLRSFGRFFFLLYVLAFYSPVFSQSELPIDEDPFIDPDGVKALSSSQRFQVDQGFLIGFLYGLNPALVFSPALSLAYYKEPFTVGIEISDSDKLEFWSKQKKEWLGPSRFGGSTVFGKLFFGQNMYLVSAYEKRFAHLTNRSYDRPPEGGKARFNLFAETTVGSFGFGFMDYGRLGFMSIDILRWSQMLSQSAQSEIIWETWSSPEIDRYEDLQKNIQSRKEDWYDTLDSPSTLLITVGLFF